MIRQQRLHHDFHLTEIINPNRTITLHSYARNLEKNKDYPSKSLLSYIRNNVTSLKKYLKRNTKH